MVAVSRGGRGPGFSLVELMLAIVLLASTFLLLMGMFPISFRSVHQGKFYVTGSQLAQAYMDQERCKPFTSMESTDDPIVDRLAVVVNGVTSPAIYETVITVLPNDLSTANKATITVQTNWRQTEVTGTTTTRTVTIQSSRTRSW